jgi:hypothetical protein
MKDFLLPPAGDAYFPKCGDSLLRKFGDSKLPITLIQVRQKTVCKNYEAA